MRIYHNQREVRRLKWKAKRDGYDRIFLRLHQTIPELHLFKNNIIEADEYDKSRQAYVIYMGCGQLRLWKSMAKEIV